MEVEFWGARGTMPVSGKAHLKYGGHTLCASVTDEASPLEMLIIDAGTGLRRLGEKIVSLPKDKETHLHLLLTHFHIDHVLGLPFFAPLYSARTTMVFYSPLAPRQTQRWLSGFMGGRYFPVALQESESAKAFRKVPEEGLEIGKFRVTTCPLHHPQGSVAYRVEAGGSSLVMATDTEPPEGRFDDRLASFIQGATCLVSDAMFTPEEYSRRQGWGHSTWEHAVALGRAGKVGQLLLSHFNPEHPDPVIDALIRQARQLFRRTSAAREGLRLRLRGGTA